MNSYRNFFPVSPKPPVQVFLKVHKGFYGRGCELYAPDNRAPKEGPDSQDILADRDRNLVRLHLIFGKSGLKIQETPHCPGCSFHTIKVRPVREELYINRFVFNPFNISPYHGHPFYDDFLICSCELFEAIVLQGNYRHWEFISHVARHITTTNTTL